MCPAAAAVVSTDVTVTIYSRTHIRNDKPATTHASKVPSARVCSAATIIGNNNNVVIESKTDDVATRFNTSDECCTCIYVCARNQARRIMRTNAYDIYGRTIIIIFFFVFFGPRRSPKRHARVLIISNAFNILNTVIIIVRGRTRFV